MATAKEKKRGQQPDATEIIAARAALLAAVGLGEQGADRLLLCHDHPAPTSRYHLSHHLNTVPNLFPDVIPPPGSEIGAGRAAGAGADTSNPVAVAGVAQRFQPGVLGP